MSAMKRTMRHLEEDDEIDDELDQIMALMMGQYKKRKNG
jgi:hypothetical protein